MIDTEIKVTPQVAAEHGLTPDEYARIQKILGRDPNFTELGIFSVMWSEHCSYKSSRVHLKRLPTQGTHVVQGPGENAGVVDIGDGVWAVFCAIFSLWARGRLQCWIHCGSGPSQRVLARETQRPKKSRTTGASWTA